MHSLLHIYYGGGLYGFSGTYWYFVLVLPALILSLWAQIKVKRAYSSMSKIYSRSGYSGAAAAEAVLHYYGIYNVRIEQVSGKLTDHFDPRQNVIRLSQGVYSSASIAAIGIACHEAGHAAQYAQGYVPIKIRNTILPVCKIGSYAGIPLAILGVILSFPTLTWVGILLYSFIMIFQLATLPVELDASRRAMDVIRKSNLLYGEEENKGAQKVLRCAAMTYVAALAVSMANLLRFIIMFTGRGRK